MSASSTIPPAAQRFKHAISITAFGIIFATVASTADAVVAGWMQYLNQHEPGSWQRATTFAAIGGILRIAEFSSYVTLGIGTLLLHTAILHWQSSKETDYPN